MSFTREFKEFAMKGNLMDLALGVIIGAAFGKIVDSLVKRRDHAHRGHDLWCRLQQLVHPAGQSAG